ncbi:glutamine synthetase family protein [archaeon]|nr:glutamine synthetase family protein [archaeon]
MQSVEFVRMEFVDMLGGLKGFEIPEEKYCNEKYVSLDGSSIPGFTSIESSDLYLKPSKETMRKEANTAFVFCDIYNPKKERFAGDSRFILERVIERTGIEVKVGAEPEFYLLKENRPQDQGKYFDTSRPLHDAIPIKREITRRLKKAGLDVELKHHEVGPGQYEINFGFDCAMRTAENILLFKKIVRETAFEYGSSASFIPKPFQGLAGSGMHLHLSAWRDGENLFYDEGLSLFAKQFIAGLLSHAREITAITNPTINSYKRLSPGFEAPEKICWGYGNRSALVRIPAGGGNKTRLEYRSPDPSANPFLALAVIIAAGMDGIRKGLTPPTPIKANAYKEGNFESLPSDLREALDCMEESSLVREALGEHTFKEFLRIKREEWREYSRYVSSWERERYLMV